MRDRCGNGLAYVQLPSQFISYYSASQPSPAPIEAIQHHQ